MNGSLYYRSDKWWVNINIDKKRYRHPISQNKRIAEAVLYVFRKVSEFYNIQNKLRKFGEKGWLSEIEVGAIEDKLNSDYHDLNGVERKQVLSIYKRVKKQHKKVLKEIEPSNEDLQEIEQEMKGVLV